MARKETGYVAAVRHPLTKLAPAQHAVDMCGVASAEATCSNRACSTTATAPPSAGRATAAAVATACEGCTSRVSTQARNSALQSGTSSAAALARIRCVLSKAAWLCHK